MTNDGGYYGVNQMTLEFGIGVTLGCFAIASLFAMNVWDLQAGRYTWIIDRKFWILFNFVGVVVAAFWFIFFGVATALLWYSHQ